MDKDEVDDGDGRRHFQLKLAHNGQTSFFTQLHIHEHCEHVYNLLNINIKHDRLCNFW